MSRRKHWWSLVLLLLQGAPAPYVEAACSDGQSGRAHYIGRAVLNEFEQHNQSCTSDLRTFVEVKTLDQQLKIDNTPANWTLTLCAKAPTLANPTAESECLTGSLAWFTANSSISTYEANMSFGSPWVTDSDPNPDNPWLPLANVPSCYVDLNSGNNHGMEALLLDENGDVIDYLSVDGYSAIGDPGCSFPFDTTYAGSNTFNIQRLPDGTGDWDGGHGGSATDTEDTSNDPVPANAINTTLSDATTAAGNPMAFTIDFASALTGPVEIKYLTFDGTATSPDDYVGVTSWTTVTIPANSTSYTISIDTLATAAPVPSTFDLMIAWVSGDIILLDQMATGTIIAPSGPAHYAISYPSGNVGVTCEALPVTITAHDAAHNPMVPGAGTTISVTTSPAVDRINGVAGGSTSYTFTGTESSVTLYLAETTATTSPHIDINVFDGTVSEDGSEDARLQFVDTALLFSSTATQTACTASSAMSLRAIRTDTATGACVARITGPTDVALAYGCIDPGSCHPDKNDAVTIGALDIDGSTPISGGGSIADNPASAVTSFTTRSLKFDNTGTAYFTASYSDAGKIALHARLGLAASGNDPAAILTGSSASFVVIPESFKVEGYKSDGTTLLNNTTSSGSPTQVAGGDFQLRVTAQCSDGTVTNNYQWDTDVTAVAPSSPDVATESGVLGSFSFGSGGNTIAAASFSNGVATLNDARYSEVGSVTLQAAAANYLNDAAADISGSSATEVGRFIPDHFVLSSTSLTNRAGLAPITDDFTYLGEYLKLGFTLTAVNAQGATTQNYEGSYAHLDPTVPGNFGIGAYDPSGGSDMTARVTTGSSSGSWINGVADITIEVALSRLASPDGPYSGVQFGIYPTDGDSVKLQDAVLDLDVNSDSNNDHALIGATDLLFGRLNLLDATGHEELELPVTLYTEYFDGTGFVTNTRDDSTPYLAGNVVLYNYQDNLDSGETTLGGGGTVSGGSGSGMSLSAPGAGNRGSVDLEYCLIASSNCPSGSGPSYLLYDWDGDGSHDNNPTATARFGLYTGSDQQIYIEEVY